MQNAGRASPGGKVAMEKGMCYGTIAIAAIMLLVFLMDLFAGIPFGGSAKDSPFTFIDVFGVLASLVVGYLGVNALRDVK